MIKVKGCVKGSNFIELNLDCWKGGIGVVRSVKAGLGVA